MTPRLRGPPKLLVMNPNIKSNVNRSARNDVISSRTSAIFTGLKTRSSVQEIEFRHVCYRQKWLLIYLAIPL